MRKLFLSCGPGCFAIAVALLAVSPGFAASITGTVTNKTVNKPAAGDKVVLIQLQGGMRESNTTTTDAHGHFTLELPDEGPHLIRVDHQKAGYFHIAPPGTQSVDVDVYDVAEKVAAVTTEAEVIRAETDPKGLHVIENYFVKNDSRPPMTQLSSRAYEISLPPDAQIEASAAMAPGGMPVSSSPVPLGEKGKYAFVFPIRPGETRFQVSYQVPYNGSYKFNQTLTLPAENFAVMLPKSMKFTPGTPEFQSVNDDLNAQTFLARNVPAGTPVSFSVSGSGQMPRDTQGEQPAGGSSESAGQAATGAQTAATDTRPGGGLGNPIDTPDPLTKYRWWILGGLSLALAAAAAFFLRGKPVPVAAGNAAAAPAAPEVAPVVPAASFTNGHVNRTALLAALKDELFALETEKLEGKLTEPEYAELKGAFETVLRRALARQD